MIKIHTEKGKVLECEAKGKVSELVADFASIIGYINLQISKKDVMEGLMFEEEMMHALQVAFSVNPYINNSPEAQAYMEKEIDRMEKEINDILGKRKEKKQENDNNSNFADDFLKFLYGADDQ